MVKDKEAWHATANGVAEWGMTAAAAAKSLQSCPTLCHPIDGSLLGSSVPGILQARILERVAISFSIHVKSSKKEESLWEGVIWEEFGVFRYAIIPHT